jgi:octaprenyl-diphosphate synthase
MTLPLIYALQQGTSSEKRHIIDLIKNNSHKASAVSEVISYVKNKGGLVYAQQVMKDYQTQARKLLLQMPESVYRNSMEALVDYTIERTK